jgi:hypothetical protein
MRLSRSYDPGHEFCELTQVNLGYFIVFFNLISSFNNEFIVHNLFNMLSIGLYQSYDLDRELEKLT